MAISQNGWLALTSPPSGTSKWITGRVLSGDVKTVLDYVASRWNAEVEKIKKSWSWGWAYRPIRGASRLSNHSSATAYDLNAPAHPLGAANTFSPNQLKALRKIEKDLDGVVRFGQFYNGRKDGMHIEIDANRAAVRAMAAKIRAGKLPQPGAAVYKPKLVPVNAAILRNQFLIAAGVKKGKIFRSNDVARIQAALNHAYKAGLAVDGYCGEKTLNAWGHHESKVGPVRRPRIPDSHSLRPLGKGRFNWFWPDVKPGKA